MQIKLRRGTSAEWSSANPVLAEGEAGYDSTLNKLKIGNGVDTWSALSFLEAAESDLSITDVVTGNVSTSAHGFAPKAPNDTAKFLRGDATWASVPGGVTKYVTTVGDGTNTTLTVTHSLGTRNVIVQVYLTASPYDQVDVGVEAYDTNNVKLYFATAPASGAYTVVILG